MSDDEGRSAPGTGRPGNRLASTTLGALRVGRDTPAAPPVPEVVEPDIAEPDIDQDVDESAVEADAVPVPLDKPAKKPARAATAVKTVPRSKPKTKTKPEPKRRRRASRWTMVCALVAFLALAFAVVTGVRWWTAGHSHERRVGLARIEISKDAVLAISTVNSSDYRKPRAALDNWLRVSTGSLHAQFAQSRSAVAKLLGEAKMVTRATVLDTAVTDVNLTKGKASVIASVNMARTPASGAATTVRNRYRGTMTRVGSQWKLSDLTVVPVSLS